MLRRFIETRERAHHGRDTNRRPSDFEWGLEHVGIASNGAGPSEELREYASAALSDSPSFYATPPASDSDYELKDDILKFSSSIETPYTENNVVWGRFFPADKHLAVIVLPQWNSSWDSQVRLCRILQRAGITALRLSLPYHHRRKPPHLERSEYLISSNIGRTLAANRQAVLDVKRSVDWLLEKGYRRVGVVGTSIGSCIGFLSFVHDTRISTAAFIHVSGYFADVVWHGLSTQHVRRSLEMQVDLPQLRYLWSPISPFPFMNRLQGDSRRFLALSGQYDLSFPANLSIEAYRELDRWGAQYELTWLPCGHYTMANFPFSAIAVYRIVHFLSEVKRGQ